MSEQPAFAANKTTHIETGQDWTLLQVALTALAALVSDKEVAGVPELQYLQAQANPLNANGRGWTEILDACLKRPSEADEQLVDLGQILNLSPFELLVAALAAAVEESVMVGRVLAHLQAPLGGSRPTLGLLATAFGGTTPDETRPLDLLLTGRALESGLLVRLNTGAPLPEQTLSMPLHLCLALAGRDGYLSDATIGISETARVPLPESVLETASRHAQALAGSSDRALLLRSGSPTEARATAAAIAERLDKRPLFLESETVESLTPWLHLRNLLPVFCFELSPGELKRLPSPPLYDGPVLALCGPDGHIQMAGGAVVSWTIPTPPQPEREDLWQQALANPTLAADLAREHRHSSGRIANLGRLAQHHSILAGRSRPTRADILAAAWAGEGGGLETLAQPLPDPIADSALVMTRQLEDELQSLLLRCRARDSLVDNLGDSAKARYQPGVRALLVGPSGTGKTLAAGWLATKLGLPLYRVDMASVTSKYIGETEKNLATLLAQAEQSEVVLLFDEADSLFGKRTDVQQANDRFANAQTNYLLQRIEAYDGIALLTSNSRERFDSAFTRRLDLIIDFPTPGPQERRSLWYTHLGENHSLTAVEINRLAAASDFNGGQIRNVVLAAAALAQSEKRPVSYNDIAAGLASEYRKHNRQMPGELRPR